MPQNPNPSALSTYQHVDPEKHLIGESLLAPARIILGGPASVGNSPIVAREDHSHGGLISFTRKTADQNVNVLSTVLTSPTLVTASNRRYKFSIELLVGHLAGSTVGTVWITGIAQSGGNYYKNWLWEEVATFDVLRYEWITEEAIPSGSAWVIHMAPVTPTGNITVYGSNTIASTATLAAAPRFSSLLIEEIGSL